MSKLYHSIPVAALLVVAAALPAQCQGQQPTAPQPLNALISDFGTTFIFDPPPICPQCLETELGIQSLDDARYAPLVITAAPFSSHTDVSLLVNLLDSEALHHSRTTNFGNRVDLVVRQQVLQRRGFLLTAAPRGTIFMRGGDGGRVGATIAPQYSRGSNLIAANLTWSGAVGVSAGNPRSDFIDGFDFFRTLESHGTTIFLGFQHEVSAGQQSVGTEQGLEIPFRNGQIELAMQQLNLNTEPTVQFQARAIVNWGRIFAPR